jgi:hypothetical protein
MNDRMIVNDEPRCDGSGHDVFQGVTTGFAKKNNRNMSGILTKLVICKCH